MEVTKRAGTSAGGTSECAVIHKVPLARRLLVRESGSAALLNLISHGIVLFTREKELVEPPSNQERGTTRGRAKHGVYIRWRYRRKRGQPQPR